MLLFFFDKLCFLILFLFFFLIKKLYFLSSMTVLYFDDFLFIFYPLLFSIYFLGFCFLTLLFIFICFDLGIYFSIKIQSSLNHFVFSRYVFLVHFFRLFFHFLKNLMPLFLKSFCYPREGITKRLVLDFFIS